MIVSSISWIDIVSLFVLPVGLPIAVGYFTATNSIATFWKRLILAGLAFATTALTELLDAVAAGNPYDIGMAFLRFAATYLAAEGVYRGFLKAPLSVTVPEEAVTEVNFSYIDTDALKVSDLKALLTTEGIEYNSKATKPELVAALEEGVKPAEIVLEPEPKTLAGIIQSHGVQ